MVRMQVQFTEGQAKALRRLASQQDRSMSAIVREAVDHRLSETGPNREELIRRFRAVQGQYRSGLTDLAQRHDHYLEDAYDS